MTLNRLSLDLKRYTSMAKSDEDQKRASSKDFPSDPTYPQEREGRGEPRTDDEYFPSIREGGGSKVVS